MPTPTIPPDLRPLQSPYSFEGPGGVMGTEVGGGMPRVAMDYDRGVQAFHVTMMLKPVQLAAWTTFFHHTIKKGAISFQMHLDSGYGPSLHVVTMIPGSYSAARASNRVSTSVTFGVWAESQAYALTAEEAQSLLDFYAVYGEGSTALLDRLEQFATVDTLVLS